MTLTVVDKDRLMAAISAAALRVIRERQLPIKTPDLPLGYTEEKEDLLLNHLEFAKVADKEP